MYRYMLEKVPRRVGNKTDVYMFLEIKFLTAMNNYYRYLGISTILKKNLLLYK